MSINLLKSDFHCTLWSIGALLITAAMPLGAATRCVNQGGTGGCSSTIGAAVTAAAAGDMIQVGPGVYKESVAITKSLSLVGAGSNNTTIDSTGKRNGITVTGASNVAITGFTVENAEAAGIWITGSSFVTISNNQVTNNDMALVTSGASPTCPALTGTPFEQGEAMDCGEGIFLSAVDHSVISGNTVMHNAGGILITDDTGASHDNLISDNDVVKNVPDCGITVPSHSGAGVYHNTIVRNEVSYNGDAGVGIFAPGPGSKAYANVVAGNRMRGNGIPGVSMHNHAAPGVGSTPAAAPPVVFDDNVIVGNDISGNGADDADAATSGPTGINVFSLAPMSGTVIAQNVIQNEALDIVIKTPAASATAFQVHLNDLTGTQVGLQNSGAAGVNATLNWWGCSGGPGAKGCTTVSGSGVVFAPWQTHPSRARNSEEDSSGGGSHHD
jgi:parallel beta-helix repeat protein